MGKVMAETMSDLNCFFNNVKIFEIMLFCNPLNVEWHEDWVSLLCVLYIQHACNFKYCSKPFLLVLNQK